MNFYRKYKSFAPFDKRKQEMDNYIDTIYKLLYLPEKDYMPKLTVETTFLHFMFVSSYLNKFSTYTTELTINNGLDFKIDHPSKFKIKIVFYNEKNLDFTFSLSVTLSLKIS